MNFGGITGIKSFKSNAAGNIDLKAESHDSLIFIGGSLAGTAGKVGIGGTISVYSLTAFTRAYVDSADVTAGGDMSVKALEDISVTNLGGNVAYGGKAGIGASVNFNVIVNETTASVSGSTLDVGGNLEVSATSTPLLTTADQSN